MSLFGNIQVCLRPFWCSAVICNQQSALLKCFEIRKKNKYDLQPLRTVLSEDVSIIAAFPDFLIFSIFAMSLVPFDDTNNFTPLRKPCLFDFFWDEWKF
jgi:hypothetical protein